MEEKRKLLNKAVGEHLTVLFDYVDEKLFITYQRFVEPQTVYEYNRKVYMIGKDLKTGIRRFDLEGIQKLELLI